MKRIEYQRIEDIISPREKYKDLYEEFLRRKAPPEIVNDARTIMPYVRETLDHLGMTDTEVKPASEDRLIIGDIILDVQHKGLFCLLYEVFYETPTFPGMNGYAIDIPKEARVRGDLLENVMAVTGHELGHLFTPQLTPINEEAKAYAFQYAWCKAIQEHNIADLGDKPLRAASKKPFPTPHREAHQFVTSQIRSEVNPLQLYWDIASCRVKLDPAYIFEK